MKSDVYNLVTINDGKTDNAAIVKVFSEMVQGRLNCDLKLLNYYDEVPVSYVATIATVDRDSVELTVHEHQAVIMKYDKNTIIKSKHFHNDLGVHCYAAYVNVPKKTVILHNFAYAQIRADRRESVRVKVHGKSAARFTYENVNIEGTMVDISGNGISILSDMVSATETEQAGLLYFTISGIPMSVPASFIRATAIGSDGYICIFKMMPDMKNDSIIGKFIYQRQVEIILQLKDGLVLE